MISEWDLANSYLNENLQSTKMFEERKTARCKISD